MPFGSSSHSLIGTPTAAYYTAGAGIIQCIAAQAHSPTDIAALMITCLDRYCATALCLNDGMKSTQFYCEPIQVETGDKLYLPAAFSWRGNRYLVLEVMESWQDWGFGGTETRKKSWWLRHHRNYFLVRTDGNEVFKIYCDRGTKMGARRQWILLTREARQC